MQNRKLTIEIIDGKLEIELTNLTMAEAMILLKSSVAALLQRELLRMGCEWTGARFSVRGEMDENPNSEIEVIKQQFPNDPIAKTMSDLVTPKQLVAIRAIANAGSLNAEVECMEHPNLKCRPEELSRVAASKFIVYLKLKTVESNSEGDRV
jgi:hypothetical protein